MLTNFILQNQFLADMYHIWSHHFTHVKLKRSQYHSLIFRVFCWCGHGDGDANMEVNDTHDVNGVVINTVADFHLDVKHQKSGSRHYRSIVTLGNLKISIGKHWRPFWVDWKTNKEQNIQMSNTLQKNIIRRLICWKYLRSHSFFAGQQQLDWAQHYRRFDTEHFAKRELQFGLNCEDVKKKEIDHLKICALLSFGLLKWTPRWQTPRVQPQVFH